MLKATLLVREGCHLCEDFEQDLVAEFGADAFLIERADVDSRPDWQRRWGLKIPVLLDEQGMVIGQAPFDPAQIAEYLGKT